MPPSTRRTSIARAALRRDADTGRPRNGHSRRAVLRAPVRHRLRLGAPLPRPAPLAAAPCRPQPGRQGATGVTLLFISGTGSRRDGAELDADRRSPRVHEGARARPSQPHRRRLRRHTVSALLLGDNLETLDDRPKGLAILERIRTSS